MPLVNQGTFSITQGDILALIGSNGSGKSTLLQCLFGTKRPKKLSWSLDGKSLGKPSPKSELIAYLPQHSFLPKNLTPSDVIAMMYKTHERQKNLFQIPYISDYSLKKIGNLSMGAARFVEIVVILHLWHPIILLDEPFSLLAPLHRQVVKDLIIEKVNTKAILITDHYSEDIQQIATQKMALQNTQLISIPTDYLSPPIS